MQYKTKHSTWSDICMLKANTWRLRLVAFYTIYIPICNTKQYVYKIKYVLPHHAWTYTNVCIGIGSTCMYKGHWNSTTFIKARVAQSVYHQRIRTRIYHQNSSTRISVYVQGYIIKIQIAGLWVRVLPPWARISHFVFCTNPILAGRLARHKLNPAWRSFEVHRCIERMQIKSSTAFIHSIGCKEIDLILKIVSTKETYHVQGTRTAAIFPIEW